MLTEVDKLESQVRGILDFARPFEPHLELVALDAAVGERARHAGDAHGGRGRAGPRRRAAVVAEGGRRPRAPREQALHELAGNALDVMPGGGRLTVAASTNGHARIRLTLADTAPASRRTSASASSSSS